MKRRVRLLGATLACLLLSGCALQGLSFRVDDRVKIVSPSDREKVPFPIKIDWEVTEFSVTGQTGGSDPDSGYFGVFLDRAPQPPGQTVKWFAKNDRTCRPADGCPDRKYLSVRGIHTTDKTEFVIPRLPQPSDADQDRREFHEITVVLLDGSGRRIGESAFTVQFEVDREIPAE